MKKFFLLIILAFILSLIFVWNANDVAAASSDFYYSSDNSFEHSQENYFYYERVQKDTLLGYVWTKTGDLVNILKELCVSGFEDTKPLASAQGATLLKLLQGSNELSTSVIKALGPGQEIFQASHHPWIFLMSLSFGTLLLSLWFLRLSTGVSPPLGQFTGPVR
mgnify:CR=1 FL=1